MGGARDEFKPTWGMEYGVLTGRSLAESSVTMRSADARYSSVPDLVACCWLYASD